jgi:hypothetical protein
MIVAYHTQDNKWLCIDLNCSMNDKRFGIFSCPESDLEIGWKEETVKYAHAELQDKDQKIKNTKSEDPIKFEWDFNQEDDYIYRYGVHLMWVCGRKEAIQKFVQALSQEVGKKCDFAFTSGRAHIDVYSDVYDKACEVISNSDFMSKFIVPFSHESWNDGTYFEVI